MVCRGTILHSGGSRRGWPVLGFRLAPDLPLQTDFHQEPFTTTVTMPGIVAEQATDSPFQDASAS
jgi:hypothetical protein